VRGAAAPETAVRTAWSLSTLHEQMIIGLHAGPGPDKPTDRGGAGQKQRKKYSLQRF